MGPCDICGEKPQQMQIGNMETGQQLFVCAGCFARWGLDFAKAALPPEEIAAQVGPMFVDPAREDLHEGAKAETAKRSRKKAPKPPEAEGETGGAPEVAAASADE